MATGQLLGLAPACSSWRLYLPLQEKGWQLGCGQKSLAAVCSHQLYVCALIAGCCLQVLREDVEASLAEASLAQERTALLALEQQELQRQRDQLTGEPCNRPSALSCGSNPMATAA